MSPARMRRLPGIPCTISSLTLISTTPGNPYSSAGADRAPCAANTRAATSSSSPVVTPARTFFANASSVSRATSAACFNPSQSAIDSMDIVFSQSHARRIQDDEWRRTRFSVVHVLVEVIVIAEALRLLVIVGELRQRQADSRQLAQPLA